MKNQGLSDDEVDNGIVGKGLDEGCDSIYLFLDNLLITPDVVEHISAPKDSILEMIIIQSKKNTSFGEDAVMKWKTISGNLLDLSKTTTDFTARYNADVLEAFTTFRDTYTRLITSRVKLKFRFYYATLVKLNKASAFQAQHIFSEAPIFTAFNIGNLYITFAEVNHYSAV